MTHEEQLDREVMAQFCEMQTECAVVERYALEELVAMGPEGAARALTQREEAIAHMSEFPLTHCWVPDDWWLFLLELCEKRIAHPGKVLEVLISGGIRAGKTFIAAMLTECHRLYARRASVFCLSRTDATSQKLQQKPIESFMLPEVLGGDKGSVKQSKHEKAKFSGGKFTDNRMVRFLEVTDENGVSFVGGGEMEFRMFTQEVESYRGYALTMVWSDEAVPVAHVKALFDRLASRAIETHELSHRRRMLVLREMLRALVSKVPGAERPHPALLGALMHGVHLITYTPEEGYTPTVRYFLDAAIKPEKHKVVAPELDGKPGVKDPRVPKIAYPVKPTRLVCYLHTSQNRIVNVYAELSGDYRNADERTIRIKLYGDAEAATEVMFGRFSDRHIVKWKDVPRQGTLYLVTDPAPEKPWAITIYLVDAAERVWVLMRWPSPGWMVKRDGAEMDPGAWAVPTSGNNMNGDKGPAAKLRLDYTLKQYTHLVYEMLKRVLVKFEDSGGKFEGTKLVQDLTWENDPEMNMSGEFAWPVAFIGDKRWMGSKVQRENLKMTLHAALMEEENALPWEVHEGEGQRGGVILIQNALSAVKFGLPGLLVVDECKDTIFALSTYSVPDGKDAPPDNDQACKEDIDMLRYLLMWGAWYNAPADAEEDDEAGGSY